MNADVEELLRDGMQRFTAGIHAPAGLPRTAARLRRRRLAARAAFASGTATVVAAVAVAAVVNGGPASTSLDNAHARTAAYVVDRVEKALTGTNLVFLGRTASPYGPSVTWAYGSHYRYEEFSGRSCGHIDRNASCTHRGGPQRYLAEGTALVGGKLTEAYVTYFDRKYSLSGAPGQAPANACTANGALTMGGWPAPSRRWAGFINQTLACGAATVTGHVRVDGMETTRITGAPVTVRLSPGYAKTVRERWARARWTLYVDPTTYLPVRMDGSTETFGGPGGRTLYRSVTDVRWLPPTPGNVGKAMVTIPPGFHQVSSPADQ